MGFWTCRLCSVSLVWVLSIWVCAVSENELSNALVIVELRGMYAVVE